MTRTEWLLTLTLLVFPVGLVRADVEDVVVPAEEVMIAPAEEPVIDENVVHEESPVEPEVVPDAVE